ncbi:DUF6519 domain-containing protein [Nakamurella sp.]|uniref:DUF6519 domain-containing protein n=1 Tax=Nakamurella sp. TaxID=1869182 RepID=UPI003B3A1642
MKADVSAYTFRPENRYAAVVVGQGQVLVDSAVNEQAEITRYRVQSTAADVVGPSGVPKVSGGFAVSVPPDGADLLIEPGRIYVDGILCENRPPAVGATVVSTGAGGTVDVDSATAGGVPFAAGQWVDVITSTTTRTQITAVTGRRLTLGGTPADAVAGGRLGVVPVTSLRHQADRLPFDPFAALDPDRVSAGAYRVELDVWHRHLTPVEDPAIREVALGDAESSTRVRTVWPVRLAAAGPAGGGRCGAAGPPARATLAASTVPGPPADAPCELPDEAGYRGLENQLYRVEVHSVSATEVVLKWQRDNASMAGRVLSLGSTLLLDDLGPDRERGFTGASYVEITDDHLELEQLPSDLIAVAGTPDADLRTVTLVSAPTLARPDRHPRARRWDGVITVDPAAPAAPQTLERGVQVILGAGALRPGDYWMIPARTANSAGGGTIDWPRDDTGSPLALGPQGIVHHTTGLAIVDADNAAFLTGPANLRDCRTLFPPLTAIAAADVSIDPTACAFAGVTTVQEAIDQLCRGSGDGCCTVTAVPGPGWEAVFGKIPAGASGLICFPVGSYPTPSPVTVTGKGNLVLRGLGAGSVLAGTGNEAVLHFSTCAGVVLDSLAVTAPANSFGGAVTADRCGDVVVRNCRLTIGAAPAKQSACLQVSGGTLRVTSTDFAVGNRQSGVVAVDSFDTVVADCRFRVMPLAPTDIGGAVTTATALERIQARRLLVSGLGNARAGGPGPRVGVTVGKQAMAFGSPPAVRAAWAASIAQSYDTMKHFQKALDKVLRSVFAGHAGAPAAPIASFVTDRIIARRTAVMSQAVVVAGQTVGDVRIENNVIAAAIQGIHIGTSHRGQPRTGPADVTGRVAIRGNTIAVLVPAEGARARHAIFVGNVDRLRLTENDVRFTNLCEGDPIASDGIRIYGFIGRAMTVRDNVVDGFPGGITLNLFQARGAGQANLTRMWAVEDNLVSGASTPITAAGPLKSFVKFRGNRPGPVDN